MKMLKYIALIFLTASAVFADPTSIASLPAASAPAGDDSVLIDGATNETRRLLASYFQPYDTDLAYLATFTPSANAKAILNASNYAAIRALLDLEAGTDFLAFPSGTPTGSKFLRDDNSWQVIPTGDTTLAGDNAFTGSNSTEKAIRTLRYDLAGATSLNIGTHYFDNLSAIRTLSFSGTPANASSVSVLFTVSGGPITLTFPSCKRVSQANTTITTLPIPTGIHTLTWFYVNSTWYLFDTVPGVVDLAGTGVTGTLPAGNGGTGVTSLGASVAAALQTALNNATGGLMTVDGTASPTNKTFDANGTGNVMKWIEEVQLVHPHQVDGTGATFNTTNGATYGHATFSNSTDQATNYVLYRFGVPYDFDANTDLAASFSFRLGGADTGKHRYVISMADVTDSGGADSPTFSNAINLDFAGDASGASGDRENIAYTTLTSWRTSLTAGHTFVIKLARDGDDATNDTSTVNSTDMNLKIKIGHAQ